MAVKLIDIAAACDRNYKTLSRQITQLKKSGKFSKTSPGQDFSPGEVKQLEQIYGFKFRKQI